MNEALLEDPAFPLLKFAKLVGIPKKDLYKGEELKKLIYTDEQFEVNKIRSLTMYQVIPLIEAYGEALDFKLLLGNLLLLDIKPGISEEEINTFLESVQNTPTVELELIIDKKKLAERLVPCSIYCRPFLFFFADTLIDFLKSEPERLRKELWGVKPDCKVLLFVPGQFIRLNGPYLAILGGDALHSWEEVIPAEAPDLETIEHMYKTCRNTLKWLDFQLGNLTPLHLKLEGEYPAKDSITNLLLVHLVNLVILYTADRTKRRSDGCYETTYAGANQTVTFELAKPGASLDESAQKSAEWFIKTLEWTYERINGRDCSENRLPFVQISVCQALRSARKSDHYQLLVYNAENFFYELQWHWKAFIEGKMDAYTAKVKDLEDYVDVIVAAFADQVSVMIDNLSKTMLAAIATVLGSFIGAVFKDEFNSLIFIIGMSVYAAYVLLYPLCYNMVNTWGRYQSLKRGFEERRQRFEVHLYANKVNKIIGRRVDGSRKRFIKWFLLTAVSYVIVIVLAILAAIFVPAIMATG